MNFFENIFKINKKQEVAKPEEKRYYGVTDLGFGSFNRFSESSAMKIAAVNAAVNQISNSISQLKIELYKQVDNNKIKLTNDFISKLNLNPDKRFSKTFFIKAIVESLLLTGNAYILVERDEKLNCKNLTLLNTCDVTPRVINGEWEYTIVGFDRIVKGYEMINIYQHLDSQFKGISVIRYAYNTLNTINAQNQMATNIYSTGGQKAAIIKSQRDLNNAQKEQISNSWNNAFNRQVGKVPCAILPSGLELQEISLSPADAQLLQSEVFGIQEIARFFNINPIKIYDYSQFGSTANLEYLNLQYLSETIAPLAELIINEFNIKIFKPSQIGNLYLSFNYNSLLKSDTVSEGTYYKSMLTNGIMSINEVREEMGLPLINEPYANENLFQLSYASAKNIVEGKYIKENTEKQTSESNTGLDNMQREDINKEEEINNK